MNEGKREPAGTNKGGAATFGLLGGLFASIVVALVSTWGAAEADRHEALRQERRSAYADFLGEVATCEGLALSIRLDIEIAIQAGIKQGLEEGSKEEAINRQVRKVLSQVDRCTTPMQVALAKVSLLSNSPQLEDAGHKLLRETVFLLKSYALKDDQDQTLTTWATALVRFESLAQESSNAPWISPQLLQGLGLLIAGIVLLFVGIRLIKAGV